MASSGRAPQRSDALDPAVGRILMLAVQAENDRRYMTAVNLYTEGIQLLVDGVRGKNSLVNFW